MFTTTGSYYEYLKIITYRSGNYLITKYKVTRQNRFSFRLTFITPSNDVTGTSGHVANCMKCVISQGLSDNLLVSTQAQRRLVRFGLIFQSSSTLKMTSPVKENKYNPCLWKSTGYYHRDYPAWKSKITQAFFCLRQP